MTHFLTIPINENGIITDGRIGPELATAAEAPFNFTDVFIYSHGWWNTAADAAGEYNAFSLGVARSLLSLQDAAPAELAALAMGIHWPSMLSEDQNSVANFFEAASFYSMQMRADSVGQHGAYALLRLFLEARSDALASGPVRFHLIGHSFGCRVILSALQALTEDEQTRTLARQMGAAFNVVLLQAAADADSLDPGALYGDVLGRIPNLRLLVTTSERDLALHQWYPAAQRIAHLFSPEIDALGATGPEGVSAHDVDCRISLSKGAVATPVGDFVIADLTPLHDAYLEDWIDAGNAGNWGGQHSDIFHDELYQLVARFILPPVNPL